MFNFCSIAVVALVSISLVAGLLRVLREVLESHPLAFPRDDSDLNFARDFDDVSRGQVETVHHFHGVSVKEGE